MPTINELIRALDSAAQAGDATAVEALRSEIKSRVPQDIAEPQAGPSSAFNTGKTEPSSATQAWMNAAQGPLFGWADEAAGLVSGTLERARGGEFSGPYREGRDYYRGAVESAQQQNPLLSTLGQVSAGMLLAGPLSRGIPAKPQTVRPITAGMGYGALSGAGSADELADIPEKAGLGALFGGGTVAGLKGAGSVIGMVSDAVRGSRVGMGALQLARRRVAEAIERDELTPETMGATLQGMGQEARMADAGGQNVLGLLQTVGAMPGRSKNQLEEAIKMRQKGRAGRMDEILNPANVRFNERWKTWQTQKQQDAGPFYKQLETMSARPSEEVVAAGKLGAFTEARKLATAERRPFPLDDKDLINLPSVPMRDLDYVKRGLDTLIEGQTDPITGQFTSLGRAYVSLKNDLLKYLDDATKDPKTGLSIYKEARNAFAGPASLQTAMSQGRAAVNLPASKIERVIEGMSESEREAFRIGATEALREQYGTMSGQTKILNEWRDRTTQERLEAIFGSNASRIFQKLNAEFRMKGLERLGVTRNSATAPLTVGFEDLGMGVAQDAAAAAKGNALPLFMRLYDKMRGLGTPEPVRDEIGRILLTQRNNNGSLQDWELGIIRQAIDSANRATRQSGAAQRIIGGQAGQGVNSLLY